MAVLMSELSEQAVKLLWFQCDTAQFPLGIQLLEQAAIQGDAEALYFLARCHLRGEGGLEADRQSAYALFQKGAKDGSFRCPLGALRAGMMDDAMRAIAYSMDESFAAVRRASEAGEPFAAYQIGSAYYWGDVEQIPSLADKRPALCIPYFERAAEDGLPLAMRRLGICYYNGEHVLPNPKKFVEYAGMAASLGDAWGEHNMGLYAERTSEYTAMRTWYEQALLNGYGAAASSLGRVYQNGVGCEKNPERAVQYYAQGIQLGDEECLYQLGKAYFYGNGVEADFAKAHALLQRCYAFGDQRTAGTLAFLSVNGFGCERDETHAKELFEQAAGFEEDGYAHFQLGLLFERGRGIDSDLEQAAEHYRQAAEMGYESAKNRLAYFRRGFFTKRLRVVYK